MRLVCLQLIVFFSFASVFSEAASTSSERKCTIKQMVGSVKILKGASTVWNDARLNMPLKETDAVRTFVESEAVLETSEGTTMTMGENTTVELDKLFGDAEKQQTSVKILNGSVLANVKKLMSTNSTFDFETPTATAAIRGTLVSFDVSKDETSIKVYEGKVWVVPEGSQKGIEIQPNQMGVVKKGVDAVDIKKLEENSSITKAVAVDSTLLKDSSKVESASESLRFLISAPFDGQEFKKPLVSVSGTTTPGAEVTVMSMKLPVSSNGQFTGQVPIANETGEYNLEFEASLNGKTQRITRKILFKPEYRFIVTSPGDRQTITSTMFTIKGEVLPANSEVSVMGRRLSVSNTGLFSGLVTIPDEEGEVLLEFEITSAGINKSETRKIIYQRPPDVNRPQISASLAKGCWSITAFDRTPDEEITLFIEIDGSKDSKTLRPNESTCIPLEEGVHSYSVYAEDKAGNISTTESLNSYSYLATKSWYIKMRKPSGNIAIDLPPASPAGEASLYTVEFSIENLPDDNMNLIHEINITNKTNGKKVTLRSFTDNNMDSDIDLARNKTNQIQIDVRDINNIIKTQAFQITIR